MTDPLCQAVAAVGSDFSLPIGIHVHNDAELAVANSLSAVCAGARMIQGTINGYGERCGNANLISLIPSLEQKMEGNCLPEGGLQRITHVAHTVDEIANRTPWTNQPYVGRSAFAHKGGVHANAVMKNPRTYEHIEPETVGNQRRILVSDLSGRSSLMLKAREYDIDLDPNDPATQSILERLKVLEHDGYQFDGADGSFKLLVDRAMGTHPSYFTAHEVDVRVDLHQNGDGTGLLLTGGATARIKLEVGGVVAETKVPADNGPVNAMDKALRKLLDKFYPSLTEVELVDYKGLPQK